MPQRSRPASPARPAKPRAATEPASIPPSLAGRWVAWSADGLRIVGSGTTLAEAIAEAAGAGESDPILERATGAGRR